MLAALLFAGAPLLKLLATGGDLEALRLDQEAKLVADLVLDARDLIAFEFDDLIAILANNMVMVGVLGVVGIVKFVIFAEIHLAHQAALRQEGQGAVNRRA